MTPTRYEITLRAPDDSQYLLSYAAIRTWKCLNAVIKKHRDDIIAKTGQVDLIPIRPAGPCYRTDHGWTIGYTGRTQLDAQQGGEHPKLNERVHAPARPR